jgi:hypothetical protein
MLEENQQRRKLMTELFVDDVPISASTPIRTNICIALIAETTT